MVEIRLSLQVSFGSKEIYVICLMTLLLEFVKPGSSSCLSGIVSYDARQPNVTLTATPFPYISNRTNVTLTCEGRSKFSDDLSYVHEVRLQKGLKVLRSCFSKRGENLAILSCRVHDDSINSRDTISCTVEASQAPCNFVEIRFKVYDQVAPAITNQEETFDVNFLGFTCSAIAFPEPSIKWILYTIENTNQTIEHGEKNSANVLNKTIETTSEFRKSYHDLPLRVQCSAMNEVNRTFSNVIYAGYIEFDANVTQDSMHVEWRLHSSLNFTTMNISGCMIYLRNRNESKKIKVASNASDILIKNLTSGSTYIVHIASWLNSGDKLVSAASLVTTTQFISVINVTSKTAIVQWQYVAQNEDFYGKIIGSKITWFSRGQFSKHTSLGNVSSVLIKELSRNSTYDVVIYGYSDKYNWTITEGVKFKTLGRLPRPRDVRAVDITVSTALLQWANIPVSKDLYDEVLGYKIVLSNASKQLDLSTCCKISHVTVRNLLPNSTYHVTVRGYSKNDDGEATHYNFTTLVPSDTKKRQTNDKNGMSDGLLIALVVVGTSALILIVVLVTLNVRKRQRKSQKRINIRPEEIKNRNNNFDINLDILFPGNNNGALEIPEDSEKWEISRSKLIVFEETLGGGHFGVVKKGVLTSVYGNGHCMMDVAVKTVKNQNCVKDCDDLLCELEILIEVNVERHPNIIGLVGACTKIDPTAIIFEYCSGGNLRDFLVKSRAYCDDQDTYTNIYSTLNERQLITLAAGVANGMIFLAKHKVVHRDLATRNILMDGQNTPKIADFGLARKIDANPHYIVRKSKILPVKWLALESLEEGRFNTASDVWSCGVLLWEICTLGEEPYEDVSPYDILEFLQAEQRMIKPKHCSDEIFSLMESCWESSPEKRPEFQDIYNALQEMLLENERVYLNVTAVPAFGKSGSAEINTENHTPGSTSAFSHDSGICDTSC